jgi:hypothetical protein
MLFYPLPKFLLNVHCLRSFQIKLYIFIRTVFRSGINTCILYDAPSFEKSDEAVFVSHLS